MSSQWTDDFGNDVVSVSLDVVDSIVTFRSCADVDIRATSGQSSVLSAELSDKRFAVGETPTIADIAAHSYIAHAPEGGVSLEPYPHIRAWLKRVEALPRFLPMPASKAGLLAEAS